MAKKYSIIYADPPWSFNNKNTGGSMKSGSAAKYKVMTLEEMKKLDIQSICEDDCILFMWWVASQPIEAIQLAERWGFKLKTMTGFTWVKLTTNFKRFFGMGFYTRQGTENVLIAIKGKSLIKKHNIRNLVIAKAGKHSKKPNCIAAKIARLTGYLPRLEMFARDAKKGWDVFGDETKDSIFIPEVKKVEQLKINM